MAEEKYDISAAKKRPIKLGHVTVPHDRNKDHHLSGGIIDIDDPARKTPVPWASMKVSDREIGDWLRAHKLVKNKINIKKATTALKKQSWRESLPSGRDISVVQADAPWQIIYGTMRVGATLTCLHTSGSQKEWLSVIATLAGHEIDSVSELYLDGYPITFGDDRWSTGPRITNPVTKWHDRDFLNRVFMSTYGTLGALDQVVNPDANLIIPSVWTSAHRQRGFAYAYLILVYDGAAYPNGMPDVEFKVKGKKCYNPRTNSTAWTNNAALILADYLTDSRYGCGFDWSQIDTEQLEIAESICNELVTRKDGTTEARYTIDGTFTSDADKREIIQQMAGSMAGDVIFANGKWRILPGKWVEIETPIEFTLDDVRGEIQIETMISASERHNSVKGTFVSSENSYEITDFPAVSVSAYVTEDSSHVSWLDLTLPFTVNSSRAQRIARILLEKERRPLTVRASFSLKAFEVDVGDYVYLTIDRYGWDQKTFRVMDYTFEISDNLELLVSLELKEDDEFAYSWTPAENEQDVHISPDTTLPNPNDVAPISNLSLASGTDQLDIRADGTIFSRIHVSWTAPADIFVTSGGHIEVQYRKTDINKENRMIYSSLLSQASSWNPSKTALSFVTPDVMTITEDSSAGVQHKIDRGNSPYDNAIVSGTSYQIEFTVKANGRNYLFFYSNTGWQLQVQINLANGTLGTVSGGTATISDEGDGWYRVVCTFTAASSASNQFNLYLCNNSDYNVTYTGDGTSGVFFKNPALRVARADPDYVPTTTYPIYIRPSSESDWISLGLVDGNSTHAYILDVKDSVLYDVRVRAKNAIGSVSSWVTESNYLVLGKSVPPSNVTGLSASLSPGGILLRWDSITDLDLAHYEIRQGSSWASGAVLAKTKATAFLTGDKLSGNYQYFIKAQDTSNNYSTTEASLNLAIGSPVAPVLSYRFSDKYIVLEWTQPNPTTSSIRFDIEKYKIYEGSTLIGEIKGNSFQRLVNWAGLKQFSVCTVDAGGNLSALSSIDAIVVTPSVVSELTVTVIDNNILLKWALPGSSSLPIDRYEVRRGDEYADAVTIGNVYSTFVAYFEMVSGTYTYWITAIDSAGNYGKERKISAVVDQPPDFVLKSEGILYTREAITFSGLARTQSMLTTENLCIDSDDFTSSLWQSPSPLGITVAEHELIEIDSSADSKYIYQEFVNESLRPYVFSFVAKPIGSRNLRVKVDSVDLYDAIHKRVDIDLANGVKHATVGILLRSESLGDGFYRYEFELTLRAQTTLTFQLLDASYALSYSGVADTGVYIEKVQFRRKHKSSKEYIQSVNVPAWVHASDDTGFVGPVYHEELWWQHFDRNDYENIQDQLDDGYYYFQQPNYDLTHSYATGIFEQVFDCGDVIAESCVASFTWVELRKDGVTTVTPSISVSDDGVTYTDYSGVSSVFTSNFRFVKAKLELVGLNERSLVEIRDIFLRVAVKKKRTAGRGTTSSGVCTVTFNGTNPQDGNQSFLDVRSITVTPAYSASENRIAVYDFVDAPNPTSFDVYTFKLDGTPTDCDFSWSAEGV